MSGETRSEALYKFDVRAMSTVGPCFFVGGTGSGKTNAMLSVIAEHEHKFETVVAFSGSPSSVDVLSKCIPGIVIYYPWDSRAVNTLNDIIAAQGRAVFKRKAKPVLLIFDDLMFNTSFPFSPEFKWLVYNGRAMKFWSLYTMQYCKQVTPGIRQQGFYAFLTKERSTQGQQFLYETFAIGFESLNHFKNVLKNVTRKRTCLVIDKGVMDDDDDDVTGKGIERPPYFWYRPPGLIEHKLKFGSGSVWRRHARDYDRKWVNDASVFRVRSREEVDKTSGSKASKKKAKGLEGPLKRGRDLTVSELQEQLSKIEGGGGWVGEALRAKALYGAQAPRGPRGPQTVKAVKRGPGRPKGSKNKQAPPPPPPPPPPHPHPHPHPVSPVQSKAVRDRVYDRVAYTL